MGEGIPDAELRQEITEVREKLSALEERLEGHENTQKSVLTDKEPSCRATYES